MANFSRNVVLVLLLFCLSRTYIGCAKKAKAAKSNQVVERRILAKVEDPKVPDSSCGAVWIGKKTLLTAASCFDHEGEIVFSQHKDADNNILRDVTIEAIVQADDKSWIKENIKGKALIHPLFKRVNDTLKMPLASDLAVVLADLGKKNRDVETAKVCSGNALYKNPFFGDKKIWIAAVAVQKLTNKEITDPNITDRVQEWKLKKMSDRNHKGYAIFSSSVYNETGEWYVINPELQFTTYLEIEPAMRERVLIPPLEVPYTEPGKHLREVRRKYGLIHPGRFGAPIFDQKTRCVAAIISFAGQEGGKQYITSTKLAPVFNWIFQTQMFLDPEFAKESALKGMKKEIDLIRPYKHAGATKKEIVNNAMDTVFP